MNHLELATHLERKAAHLHLEGLGKIKMALTGSDISSLIQILKGSFGCIDSNTTSTISAVDIPVQKPTTSPTITEEKPPEKIPATSSGESSLATAELVFPLKSLSPVVTDIPESFLPLHGPQTLSHYRCQYPSCDEEFSQKQQPATMFVVIIYM